MNVLISVSGCWRVLIVAFCLLSSNQLFAQTSLVAQTSQLQNPDSFLAQVNTDFADLIGDAELPGVALNIQPTIQPIKSDQDKRDYRYLVLPNQLRVLLIFDPEAQSSAAAINVAVGANQNPPDRLGLAHFLEHMLFLGTEKYPLPGEYQQFIAQQGGTHNASTAAENTQYFFTIKHKAFEPALDRFAQFFIAPLFNDVYVERERQAVQAEFSAKLRDDFRREWDVYRELMNPDHPGSQFAVGNNQTLADRENDMVRDDLLAFYQTHYSADKMTLVLLSNQPLSQLQSWVEEKFSAIPKRDLAESGAPYPGLFPKDFLPATIEIKPEKEIRQLSFSFPVPQSKKLFINKPYSFIGHLLGHENKGSFLSILKNLGWAEKLNAGMMYPNRYDGLFQITIQLTPKGVKARDQIVSLLFFVIQRIQNTAIEAWRYDELRLMGEYQFRYNDKKSPMETVSMLAQNMHDYRVQDILRGRTWYEKFDEQEIRQSLSYLRRDNLLVALTDPDIYPLRLTDLYSVPYLVKKDVVPIFDIKLGIKQDFELPVPNPYIPEKVFVKSGSLLNGDQQVKSVPELLIDKDRTKIWHLQDHRFNRPQSGINLHLVTPPEKMTAERSALHYLFARMIQDQLNDISYYASLAGLEFSVLPHPRGIDLSLFGFSNRQSLFLNSVLATLAAPSFNEKQFARIKAELIRQWANEAKGLPYQVMISQLPSIFTDPHWSSDELAVALDAVKFEQFSQFANQYCWDAKIEGLIYGNFLTQEAIKLSAIIEHGLQSRQTGRKISDDRLKIMSSHEQKPWLFYRQMQHQDKIVSLYIQAPSSTDADTARMQLIRQILQSEFFHQLRTEKQMGYVVASIAFPIKNVEGSLFVVQSPNFAESDIQQAIDNFLDNKSDLFKQQFATHKDSLIQKLKESPQSIREQNDQFWQSILKEDYSFDRKQRLVTVLRSLTSAELIEYYNQVFLDKNRRLWLSSADLNSQDSFNPLKNKASFKQQDR
jgi:insulysin